MNESTWVANSKILLSHIDGGFEAEVLGPTPARLGDLVGIEHVRHPDFGVINDRHRQIAFASDQAPRTGEVMQVFS